MLRLTRQINRSSFPDGVHDATDEEVQEALTYPCVVAEVSRQIKFLRELKNNGKDIGK